MSNKTYKFIQFQKSGPVLNYPPRKPLEYEEKYYEEDYLFTMETSQRCSWFDLEQSVKTLCIRHNVNLNEIKIWCHNSYDEAKLKIQFYKKVPKEIRVYKKELERYISEMETYTEEAAMFQDICKKWYNDAIEAQSKELKELLDKIDKLKINT